MKKYRKPENGETTDEEIQETGETAVGEGLTATERTRLGPLVSALERRANSVRNAEKLTAQERAGLNQRINERLRVEKQQLVEGMTNRIQEIGYKK